MCQMRIYISQINDFCINIFNGKREVTRIKVAILLFLWDKMQMHCPPLSRMASFSLLFCLSVCHTKPTSLICRDLDVISEFAEIERDRKQYSFLTIGHIHTGKERGGGGWGWGVLAARSISVRIGKRKESFWNIVANGIFRCLVGRGVSQLLLFYL